MTYTQQGDRITLEMTRGDFDRLLLLLGQAAGAMDMNSAPSWRAIQLVNELNVAWLNATNPNWTPYEIPEKYRRTEKTL